jgi:hypothetical protein
VCCWQHAVGLVCSSCREAEGWQNQCSSSARPPICVLVSSVQPHVVVTKVEALHEGVFHTVCALLFICCLCCTVCV